jgi:hypothetical protein
MINLILDLETIKCTDPEHIDYIISKIKPHHACKTAESKTKSIQGQVTSAIEKTVFDGTYGSIVTIAFAVDDSDVQSFQRTDLTDEKTILQNFFNYLTDVASTEHKASKYLEIKWVCHNKDFDLRYLYQRCVINKVDTCGIKIPVDARHGTEKVYCTMQAWKGFGVKAGGSLDSICKVLGLKGKDGVCGADVWGLWEKGEYKKIDDYCKDDVKLTREVYKRLTFKKRLSL